MPRKMELVAIFLFYTFQVFDGNLDQDSVVAHWFNARFRARFVKIVPTLFRSSTNTVCMRVEVHGCDTGAVNLN